MKFRLLFIVLTVTLSLWILAAGVLAQKETEVPAPYAGLENPFSWDDASAQAAGKLIYQYSCEMCHKQGHGYTSFLPQGPDLSTADFARRLEERPDFYFWALSEGMLSEDMPASKSTIPVEPRWQVLTYLWSLGAETVPMEVTPPPTLPMTTPPATTTTPPLSMSGALIGGIVASAVVIGLVIIFIRRRGAL